MEPVTIFAEEFALLLDAALPELGLTPRPDRPAFEQRRCFSFRLSAPSAAAMRPLSVVVTQRDVQVEFLGAYRRFVSPHDAVALIREVIEEVAIVETWYSGPDPQDCAFVIIKALPLRPFWVEGVTRIVRRSWKGTYDADKTWLESD